MSSFLTNFYSSITFLIIFQIIFSDAKWLGKYNPKVVSQVIVVDQSGHGNFTTIQDAINFVPPNNKNWIEIYIKEGVYREKLKITYDQEFIYLKGDGKRKTKIIWGDSKSIAESPTFTLLANNFIAKSMSFWNSYDPTKDGNTMMPAAASLISGDKVSFYRCGFFGIQDTLWDNKGRHYYKLCTIQGAVDFIFGGGQTIFENCAISVVRGALAPGTIGYITAQGRTNVGDTNGFVFKDCNVFGSGPTFLGRAWRGFARVLFYKSHLSDVVDPLGWEAWGSVNHEDRLTFAEEECYGPGANTSQRVSWRKQLNGDSLKKLTDLSFIDSEGWLQKQPLQMRWVES